MRVLLVRPVRPRHYRVPPLGLLYLAGSLRAAGHEPWLFDSQGDHDEGRRFEQLLRRLDPGLIGVSFHSSELDSATDFMKRARRVLPRALRVAGGPHVTARPEIIAERHRGFDLGIVGEGEKPLVDVVNSFERAGAVSAGPGIVSSGLNGHATRCADTQRWIPDTLDDLALPAWDLAPPRAYQGAPQGFVFRRTPTAPILTSRGCPHRCAFCAGHLVMGRQLRFRSPESVLEEADLLVRRYGVRELHIVDDNFTAHRGRAMEILAGLEARDLTLSFPNGLRADHLDAEMVRALKKAGTFAVNLGIESGAPWILERMGKGLRLEQVRDAVLRLHEAGVEVGGFFILGFPGETRDDIQRTIDLALDLPLDRAHFSAFLPLPGTPATKLVGAAIPSDSMSYDEVPWAPRGLTRSELKGLQRRAFLRFYLRSRPLGSLLRSIRSPAHLRSVLARASSYVG